MTADRPTLLVSSWHLGPSTIACSFSCSPWELVVWRSARMLHPALALPTSLCTLKTLAKRCLFLHEWPLHRGDEHHEVKCLSMREKGMELVWPRRDRGVWAGRTWKDIRRKKE